MDEDRFDTLTRNVGSRRTVLSGALAALFGWTATVESEAKPNQRSRCKRGKKQCRGKCIAKRKCCQNRDCPSRQRCLANGNCVCTTACCNRACCKDADCGAGSLCLSNGSCARVCGPGQPMCPNGCSCPATLSVDDRSYCLANGIGSCDDIPRSCTTSVNCPEGQVCQHTTCGDRCFPLCR
jgi:hypothetical protein